MGFQKGFTQKRWDRAREMQKFHKERTGEQLGLREFYKNDNVFTQEVIKYEVTFEMNYKGSSYEFFIPQESYTIYGYGVGENLNDVEEMNKQAIANQFRGKSKEWIYQNVNVNVRGVERIQSKYNDININKLQNNNVYAENIPSFEVGKGKSKTGANKNKYALNVWL